MHQEHCLQGFRHEALLYADARAFVTGAAAFIREGLAAGEPVLVATSVEKIGWLQAELNGAAEDVTFADMAELGRNPARIIPAWRAFLDRHQDRAGRRGIGEPIWAERSDAELVECQLHEALVNTAFAGAESFMLLCPYDTAALSGAVIDEALRSHAFVQAEAHCHASSCFNEESWVAGPFTAPLATPVGEIETLGFCDERDLVGVRLHVRMHAARHGLDIHRIDEAVLVVNETASNSIRHGGGSGVLTCWGESDRLIYELRDAGVVRDPLVGRRAPSPAQESGRGVWLANQLADLVQIRSSPAGTTVRIHITR